MPVRDNIRVVSVDTHWYGILNGLLAELRKRNRQRFQSRIVPQVVAFDQERGAVTGAAGKILRPMFSVRPLQFGSLSRKADGRLAAGKSRLDVLHGYGEVPFQISASEMQPDRI